MKHTTPSEEIFNEMKKAALEIWNTYNDDYGYATEKKDRVNSITNIQDNVMVFYRMFDRANQMRMENKLSEKARDYIAKNK